MNYTNPNKQNLNEERAAALMKGGSGIGGKIVACVLSLVIGIATPIAAVAGAGAWATSQPTATVFDTINGIVGTDFKYTDFLNESYGDKTVLTLLGDVFSAATELASETATLEKFANISPKVGESVSTISDLLEEEIGLVITEEELITTPFSTMIDFFKTRFNNSPAGDILTKFGATSPLIMALCYGEEGVDYIIDENNEVQMLGDSKKTLISDLMGDDISYLLDKVPLGAMLTDLDPNNPKDDMMFALAYGTKDTTYKVIPDDSEKGWHIEMQQVFYHSDDGILFEDYEYEEIDATATPITLSSDIYNAIFAPGTSVELSHFVITHTDEETGTTSTEIQYLVSEPGGNKYLAFDFLYDEKEIVDIDEEAEKLIAEDETEIAFDDINVELIEFNEVLYKQTMVSTLTDDANVLLGHLYLKDILDVKNKDDNEVMLNLCYGVKGQDYDFNSAGEVVMLNGALPHTIGYLKKHKNDLIDSIHLADVLKPDFDSGIISYMLYGTEGLHYVVATDENTGKKYAEMQNAFVYVNEKDEVVYCERGDEMPTEQYDITGTAVNGYEFERYEHTYDLVKDETFAPKYFLYQLNEDEELEQVKNKFINIIEGQAYDENGNLCGGTLTGDAINGYQYTIDEKTYNLVCTYKYYLYMGGSHVKFEPTRLGDMKGVHNPLSDFQENLALSDILPESDLNANPIFKNLKDTKIADIPTATQNLTIGDIFGEELDKQDKDGNDTPDGIPDDSTWKYLLYDGEGDKNDSANYDWDLKILDDITALTTNMTKNMQSATLRELSKDGIITGLDSAIDNPLKVSLTRSGVPLATIEVQQSIKDKCYDTNGTYDNSDDSQPKLMLGELTVNELMSYLTTILSVFDD